MADAQDLRQRWPVAERPRPIVVVGAGGIVNDAHLPAYRAMSYPVAGIHDPDIAAARRTARRFGLPRVYETLEEATAHPADAVAFDLATPPAAIHGILGHLPEGAAVLIQKPLGRDLDEASRIVRRCEERKLTAACNFQLRFAPNTLALRDAVSRGLLGEIVDVQMQVNLHTPWETWPFLLDSPRIELTMHSIHYLDLIRRLLGEPQGVYCRTVGHPASPQLAPTRTTAILDYGGRVRCGLAINHCWRWGGPHAVSQLRLDGTRGAAVLKMGVNLDYPRGQPDELHLITEGSAWQSVPLAGSWFPDAFRGPMSNLQRVAGGVDDQLLSPVADAWRTMALVEACYRSSDAGGTAITAGPPS